MIRYYKGDVLASKCDIVCHQVNVHGVMGGGLALQIARKYPQCENGYREYVRREDNPNDLISHTYWFKSADGRHIANCFTQKADFYTDYEAVRIAFENVKEFAEYFDLSVGIPYKYGCGIANGDWQIVEEIIREVFEKSAVDCQIWCL